MNNAAWSGESPAGNQSQQSFCAKSRRLVYNRTGRFSAFAESRDRTVPVGTGSRGKALELMFQPEVLSRSPLGRPGR